MESVRKIPGGQNSGSLQSPHVPALPTDSTWTTVLLAFEVSKIKAPHAVNKTQVEYIKTDPFIVVLFNTLCTYKKYPYLNVGSQI